jgi:hypothetical protein
VLFQNQILRFEDEFLLLDNDESVDSIKWLDAMKSEIESMYENQVWNLMDPPEGVKLSNVNGSIRRKQTLMEMFTSTKHELLQGMFEKIKELTTMRLFLS